MCIKVLLALLIGCWSSFPGNVSNWSKFIHILSCLPFLKIIIWTFLSLENPVLKFPATLLLEFLHGLSTKKLQRLYSWHLFSNTVWTLIFPIPDLNCFLLLWTCFFFFSFSILVHYCFVFCFIVLACNCSALALWLGTYYGLINN